MSIDVTVGSIAIGILTGIFTSWLVTFYYRKKDRREKIIKDFFDDRYRYYEYIREIKHEIEFLIKEINDDDLKHLKRILINYPHFNGFKVAGIRDEETIKLFDNILITLTELEEKLDKNELTKLYLHEIRAKLAKYSIGLLKISPIIK